MKEEGYMEWFYVHLIFHRKVVQIIKGTLQNNFVVGEGAMVLGSSCMIRYDLNEFLLGK